MKKFICLSALFLTACTDISPTQQTQNTKIGNDQNPKILALDWGVAGTLTAMGVPPVATGDLAGYPDWAVSPALPDTVLDMGSRFSPNPELLAQMPIDIIIDTDFYQHLRSKYGNVRHINFVVEGDKTNLDGTPKERYFWDDYAGAVVKLGDDIGHKDKAVAYVANAKQAIIAHGATFKAHNPNYPKLAIVQFADSKNLRLYTPNSLFAPVAELMGVELVTMGIANPWGYANLSLHDLAKLDNDTCLIVIEPFSPMLQSELANTALWQRLGFGKNGERCMAVLPPVWTFGGVPSMVGFSEQLAKKQLAKDQTTKVALGANDD